jgi:hypothetical protein
MDLTEWEKLSLKDRLASGVSGLEGDYVDIYSGEFADKQKILKLLSLCPQAVTCKTAENVGAKNWAEYSYFITWMATGLPTTDFNLQSILYLAQIYNTNHEQTKFPLAVEQFINWSEIFADSAQVPIMLDCLLGKYDLDIAGTNLEQELFQFDFETNSHISLINSVLDDLCLYKAVGFENKVNDSWRRTLNAMTSKMSKKGTLLAESVLDESHIEAKMRLTGYMHMLVAEFIAEQTIKNGAEFNQDLLDKTKKYAWRERRFINEIAAEALFNIHSQLNGSKPEQSIETLSGQEFFHARAKSGLPISAMLAAGANSFENKSSC